MMRTRANPAPRKDRDVGVARRQRTATVAPDPTAEGASRRQVTETDTARYLDRTASAFSTLRSSIDDELADISQGLDRVQRLLGRLDERIAGARRQLDATGDDAPEQTIHLAPQRSPEPPGPDDEAARPDADTDGAFAAFFADGADEEPSRRWLLA